MRTIELVWTPSAHARRLLSVAAVATLAAVFTGRVGLLAIGAPALLFLISADRRPRPQRIDVVARVSPDRCVEGDPLVLSVDITLDQTPGQVDLTPTSRGPTRIEAERHPAPVVRESQANRRWELRVLRWGRWTPATLAIIVRDRSRLWQATARCTVGDVAVYPRAQAISRVVIPRTLPQRIGNHASRSAGSGVEFASIRPYVTGDRVRDIHWPATLRRGSVQTIQRVAERSADIVVAVDAFSDVGGSLARAVRGCAGVAGGHSRADDKVGLIVLGGSLTWLRPETGQRVLYRITEALLAVRLDESVVSPDLGRVPRTALPASALVVLFSPLLDDRALATIEDMRARGATLLIIDVLSVEPSIPRPHNLEDELALRLWRLDRQAMRTRLGELGITVVGWDGRRALDEVLAPLAARPLSGERR